MTRLLVVASVLIVAAACGGGAAPTATPAGGGTGTPPAQPTGQPTGQPTQPGGAADPCSLITAAELSQITGEEMEQQAEEEPGQCTFSGPGMAGLNLRFEDSDLSTARMVLGDTAADATVAGQPAVIGSLMGVIAYVEHGSQLFVVQSVLTEDTPEMRQTVLDIAEAAYARIP